MDHLRDLIFYVRGLSCTLNLGQVADSACQHIHEAGLAGTVIGPVVPEV